ncbi:bifunctional heptose 7-phosphate kinase/heptose 1-phosphate adenyltransferase [Streptomyces sp. AC536]|uniref:PfkB family carbohydrate kinase n=1 Tax=Streptomyces buecherae TaxID=2763006 RepID=UPI00164DD0B5|nr:PfkB family carbohydrate kinase [Streptomyces buecherae]MBC3986127.1 bifunctional heptose 7-phosphate kinase/heptose 1-phosphate adenyltransferase [Streptomyces buecherae]QNJ39484.1 bifunctional heptose 7-phosphate kinase/heptose 1-phosphate adenyltransferase [Streptomyces buecherae]
MSTRAPLVVVGDALLDQDIDGDAHRLAPDAPAPVVDVTDDRSRPGGAGLAAALAARDGREVTLVTALGQDPASQAVREALAGRVRLVELPLHGSLPVKTRVRAAGRPLVRVDRGGGHCGEPGDAVRSVLASGQPLLVADYGRGTADAARAELARAAARAPLLWDPHPRGGAPVPGTRLATPNAAEARALCPRDDTSVRADAARGAWLAHRWQAAAVAVTLGERGALLVEAGSDRPMLVPAPYRAQGDPCGAGDCFAAATAGALADGALPEEAVQRGVAEAAAFVAAGGAGAGDLWGASPTSRTDARRSVDAFELAASVRAAGGTVVATGGCFDLLHAGHVGLLESARRIGDCLIVCVNSDESIARLKGPGRPLTPVADRVRVLSGLGSVDAVAVFGETTPEPLLRKLRPDLWVKGGDYSVDALPEAAALREWGGQALVLPYLDGRSTTSLADRAARSAARAAAGEPRR